MINDDVPSRLERLASVVSTSNLTFDLEHRTPVDSIIALGIASKKSDVTSNVLRLYLVRTPEAWHSAKASVMGIVRRLNARRSWGLTESEVDKVATHALSNHINPVCSHCKGQGFHLIPGSPVKSHRPCEHCKGTGRRPLNKKLRTQIAATISSIEHIDSLTEATVRKWMR